MSPRTIAAGLAGLVFCIAAGMRGGEVLQAGRSATATAATTSTSPTTVYARDFAKWVGKEWSAGKVEKTPKGGRGFIGTFGNETVSLSLKDLPAHRFIRVSFDLLIIRSWDGVQELNPNPPTDYRVGPDCWSLKVEGGPTLVDTTFSNLDWDPPYRFEQDFPDDRGVVRHPPYTGAAEKKTLGYAYTHIVGPGQTVNSDLSSVYRLNLVFPHAGGDLKLRFIGGTAEPQVDESWGLAKVMVEALPAAPNAGIGREQLESLWKDLGGDDPMKAHLALWKLVSAGDDAAKFLKDKLKPDEAQAGKIAQLILDLDSDTWQTRQAASAALVKMGRSVEPDLEAALANTKSAEVSNRLSEIIKQLRSSEPASSDPRLARARKALRLLSTE